jgi:hypothetical protein
LWGTLLVTATLFLVSAFTPKVPSERLKGLTIDWRTRAEQWRGLVDWRLQLAVLSAATVGLYRWLW